MARVVLVHGAWQGAWCWERLAPRLTDAGLDVVRPTLTGSGERADELTPDVDLETHISDVAAVVGDGEEPGVLVVHSYSGMLAASVVERQPGRVRAVVFVDSFYPARSETAFDQMPPPFREAFRARAAEHGDGWRLPASDALLDVWGLRDPEHRDWVRERLTDWSVRCFESPSPTAREVLAEVPRWFVVAAGDHPSASAFQAVAQVAAADGCRVVSVPSGHDVMVEAPEALAAVIVDAGRS